MAVEKGKVKRVTRRLGVKEATKYKANLAKHELTKKSLRARMHDTTNGI